MNTTVFNNTQQLQQFWVEVTKIPKKTKSQYTLLLHKNKEFVVD